MASDVEKEKKRDHAAGQERERKKHTVAKTFHTFHSLGRVDKGIGYEPFGKRLLRRRRQVIASATLRQQWT
ncbi:hypothetical protein F3P66_05205 [Agrobacterium fabrum]|uniref:Uncharacterized protein n=1 Tax=Agrobacterium fabrum (strain C58 / ATCC 33970) TaxID=176299 RepID=Q8U578_AGRFC|nr:hypothetical protein Atu1812 [Agrobacterium fabrum str. C58]QRM58901.1 hypothetical protein F3P66_05205 [Agrobacterium fabrum]TRB26810.1 hypothetical protein EXN51_20085 [Agrobacterium fabrum]